MILTKGLLPLFFLLIIFSNDVSAVGSWTNSPVNSYYQYTQCDNGGDSNLMKNQKTSSTGYCESFAGIKAYRFNRTQTVTESVCKTSGGASGGTAGKYQCQVNPDPCPEGQDWDQENQECVEPPPPAFTCDGEPGTVIGPGGNTCVPIQECDFDNQTFNGATGSCDDPQCDYPQVAIADGNVLTCGNCGDVAGRAYNSTTKNCECTDGNLCVTPDHDDGTCPAGAINNDLGGGCGCPAGQTQVKQGMGEGAGNGSCVPFEPCSPTSSNYQGSVTKNGNQVHVCDLSNYGDDPDDTCGFVGNSITCIDSDPCSYESLFAGTCGDPTQPRDLDGDGQLDGGNEGITENSDGVQPTPLDGSSGGGGGGGSGGAAGTVGTITTTNSDGSSSSSEIDFSPLTGRQDQQTEQLTKSLVEQKITNEKLETSNNLLKSISDAFDTSKLQNQNFQSPVTDIDNHFDSVEAGLGTHTASVIGSPSDITDSVLQSFEIPASQSCNSVHIRVQRLNIDYTLACDHLEGFLEIASWMLYILTLLYVFDLATNRESKI